MLRKKTWAAIGTHLQGKTKNFTPGIVRNRTLWSSQTRSRITKVSSTASIDMAEAKSDHHPTAGRRRRHKSPPVLHAPFAIPAPQLDDQQDTENGPSDEDGEKEAKRQRSEPTTPISTSSRLPYEYDLLMGITQVGSGEAEGSEEGVDTEYHDATEDPIVLESGENKREADLSHGDCGSSSLRECIELLNQATHNSPAASHSGPKFEKETGPPHLWAFPLHLSEPGDIIVLFHLESFHQQKN